MTTYINMHVSFPIRQSLSPFFPISDEKSPNCFAKFFFFNNHTIRKKKCKREAMGTSSHRASKPSLVINSLVVHSHFFRHGRLAC